ncbi:hypothetical protein L9W92_07160 [Pelotomaculum terephthalicicum JT]|uniref:hypothetical protein n=1 Tax=Pelotomaculum terephthalicicum TaxID=206393 RepID=UPI001F04E733|nr:hypothetical protein [Pelotomaculum terephthalicicum]MCG9967832.1 hypothetical protein [Pelotomaculum terephthalicicum JT]
MAASNNKIAICGTGVWLSILKEKTFLLMRLIKGWLFVPNIVAVKIISTNIRAIRFFPPGVKTPRSVKKLNIIIFNGIKMQTAG